MVFLKSVIARSVGVTVFVLGTCMAILLFVANERIVTKLQSDFIRNSTEMTVFLASQINTGTRLKRAEMIDPQLSTFLHDESSMGVAVRVTHIDGVEVANQMAENLDASVLPPLADPDFSLETGVVLSESFLTVRAPIVLGTGESATLVGELVTLWDKAEYLAAAATLTGFLRNAFLATAGVVALAVMICTYLVVGRPLGKTVRALHAVSHNTGDVELPTSKTTEICQIVSSIEVFLAMNKDRATMLEDLSSVMGKAQKGDFSGRVSLKGKEDDPRNELRHLVNKLMTTVDMGITETVRTLEAFADQDLTVLMQGDFEGAFAKLQEDVNRSASALSATVSKIVRSAGQIQDAAAQLNQSSEASSRRSQHNAATLEETTASISVIADSLVSAADIAKSAKVVSQDAHSHAETGKNVVDQLVAKMESIKDNSQSITDIVTLIDDVAFQTNLLALNAGVEAARAGEHGKGFAVVASEVRALAQRTSESAASIKKLVSNSAADVVHGVEQAGQAGKSLEAIFKSIQDLKLKIDEISSTATDQATSVSEIRSAVTELDRSTQKNADDVQKTSELARELNSDSDTMLQMLTEFKVDEPPTQVLFAPDRTAA